MNNLKILVASYRSLPYYSASSDILNRLLLSLDPANYHLVSQEYHQKGGVVEDKAASYEVLGVIRFAGGLYQRMRPLINLLIIPWITAKMLVSIRKHQCRQVFAVYPDFRFVMAAAFAAKLLKLPFYVWTHNSMESMQWSCLFNKFLKAESFIFKSAKCIFAMSEGMKQYYETRYPDTRIVTLQHPIEIQEQSTPNAIEYDARPVRLLFSGGINAGNWDALQRLLDAFGDLSGYEIHICTRLEESAFIRRFGEWSNLVFHGFVTADALERLIQLSHVLLLPHGLSGPYPEVEYITIFPTKAVSYLNANKPIFAHVTRDSAIAIFLESKEAAVVVSDASVEQLRIEMAALIQSEAIRSTLTANALSALQYFSVRRVSSILKAELTGC